MVSGKDRRGSYIIQTSTTNVPASIYENVHKEQNPNHQRILIVEDNDELRNYLSQTLAEEYTVQNCCNGKEALTIIPEYKRWRPRPSTPGTTCAI